MPTPTPTITSFQPAPQKLADSTIPANGLAAAGLKLRTLRSGNSLQGIPLYPHMADLLANTRIHPDPDIAFMLAVCAAYSYSNVDTLAEVMTIAGLPQNDCQIFNRVVDGMLIDSTAFLVRSKDRRVAILSYRGTSPLNFNDWLINTDTMAEKIESPGFPGGQVHAGFYRNTRATQRIVIDSLRREPCDTLYITGHSLGAAMATLMAVTLKSDTRYQDISSKIRAVYSFAQPMVGDPDFVEACQLNSFLSGKVFRFIYKNDIVPHLPPTTSGRYQHFGRELRYRASMVPSGVQIDLNLPFLGGLPHCELTMVPSSIRLGLSFPFLHRAPRLWSRTGDWRDTSDHPVRQIPGLHEITNSFLEFAARRVKAAQAVPFRYSLENHLPRHYIQAVSEAASVQTQEFGQ